MSVPLEGRYIRAVQFVEQNGWIVSAAGIVVNTIDGGKTCSFQADTLMDARRMQLMRAMGGFWAPTSFEMFGDVYDTKDGGLNWAEIGIASSESGLTSFARGDSGKFLGSSALAVGGGILTTTHFKSKKMALRQRVSIVGAGADCVDRESAV